MKEEVSAVAISSSSGSSSPIIVISTWMAKTFVYTLSQISNGVDGLSIQSESSATSLQLRSHPFYPAGIQLLSGLDNGLLHIYDLNTSDSGEAEGLMVKSSKTTSLGLRPLVLHPCESTHGDEKVISVGLTERMSVIFESKDRIEFSSVNIKVSVQILEHCEFRLTDKTRMSWPLLRWILHQVQFLLSSPALQDCPW